MLIIPAIDIRGGKCVRLFKGDFEQETVFGDSPAEMAARWEDEGAKFLHLVDLDGARAGEPKNLAVVRNILARVNIPAELGGGIRDLKTIDRVLSLGVKRVILGSAAVKNPALVKEAAQNFGEAVIVGIDAQDETVKVEGWGESGDMSALDLAKKMASLGVKTIIYTDIGRDGTLEGINIAATAKLARESGLSIIASGGAKSLADIKALKEQESTGISGVILGKSLYTGAVNLKEALAI